MVAEVVNGGRGPSPPTRWILRLTIRQAPRLIDSAVCSWVSAVSSRQTGVDIAFWRGQAVEVVRRHRLFEHEQVQIVELPEDVEVGDCVGPVASTMRGMSPKCWRTARTTSTSRPGSILIFTRR